MKKIMFSNISRLCVITQQQYPILNHTGDQNLRMTKREDVMDLWILTAHI